MLSSENQKTCGFICANPTQDLPGAHEEGLELENLFRKLQYGTELITDGVGKKDFLDKINGKVLTIVHLAGHGSHDIDQVFFIFLNGRIFSADIRGLQKFPLTLFYANTCYSSWNESLALAFKERGVGHYIGFVNPIPDNDAKYFAIEVYTRWLVEGKELITALEETADEYPAMPAWRLY